MKPLLKDMSPNLQLKFAAFSAKMAEAGIPFMLTCVIRLPIEQVALYAQGRESLDDVNTKRAAAGMYLFKTDAENAFIVTKTLNSPHFPDPVTGKSHAYDIAILKGDGKTPTWDSKWLDDKTNIPSYLEAARIGKLIGLNPGGLWTGNFQDWPHYQEVTVT